MHTPAKIFGSALLLILVSSCSLFFPDPFLYDVLEKNALREKLRTPAENGNAEAQYRMGQTYCCGISKHFNNELAFNWFCQSAKRGNARAMFEVGMMYHNAYTMRWWDSLSYRRKPATGPYPERDLKKAWIWYTLALQHGLHEGAEAKKKALLEEITWQEVADAKVMMEDWENLPCGTGYMPWDDEMELTW
jgi:TPR repeat protein